MCFTALLPKKYKYYIFFDYYTLIQPITQIIITYFLRTLGLAKEYKCSIYIFFGLAAYGVCIVLEEPNKPSNFVRVGLVHLEIYGFKIVKLDKVSASHISYW